MNFLAVEKFFKINLYEVFYSVRIGLGFYIYIFLLLLLFYKPTA